MNDLKFDTREDYLTEAANLLLDDLLMPICEVMGYDYQRPPFRISVGFPPGARGSKSRASAVCYPRSVSSDGVNEIFVTPEQDDPIKVLGDVAHELIHAIDDCKSGHRNFFAAVARSVGLEGKLTATVPGPELAAALAEYVALLGAYPHHKMDVTQIPKGGTRQLKVECLGCGMIFRTSRKWMDSVRACPCCKDSRLAKS
jgi:hypothetical protein